MGLMLAEPGYHTRAFVEWEAYPRSVLIAAQRAGYFAPAPIWDDLTTFDARPLAGAIDTLIAGYPCQPFSMAGKRLGEDDPRHLWPHVARVARALGNGLRWIFLENVSGHVSLGAETVLRELWDMGFTPAVGIFSAGETGAAHERQRWFCVAYRGDTGSSRARGITQHRSAVRQSGDDCGSEVANAHGRNPSPERQQHGGQQRLQPEGGSDGGRSVDDAAHGGWAIHAGPGPEGRGEADAGRARGDVDRPASPRCSDAWRGADLGRDRNERRQSLSGDGCNDMADAGQPGSQGREWPGSPDQRDRAPASGPTAERGSLPLFPPGPGDRDAWAFVMASDPDRAPAFARRDVVAAAVNIAASLPPDKAEAIEPALRGLARGAGMAAVGRQAPALVDQAQAFTRLCNLADGLAHRTRALRLLGNGVFPLAAAYAWRALASAHGLRPVDLEAASGRGATAATDEPVRGGVR